jgi:signal transduction histidine kinase/ActR/RegA family two-component response regulator
VSSPTLLDVAHAAPVFSDRDALRAALGVLNAGWPAVVATPGATSLVLPWEAVGHGESRRLVDLPLVRAIECSGELGLDEALTHMGDAEFVVVRDDGGPVAVASRRAIVEAIATDLRAGDRQSSTPVQSVMDELPEGVIALDAEHRVIQVNTAGGRMLRLLAGRGAGDILDSLGGTSIETLIDDARSGTPRDIVGAEASRVYSVRTLCGSGKPGHSVLILRDVTHVRQRQAHEVAQERMALVGQLASSVAHDFNNLLTVILGQATLMESTVSPGSLEAEAVATILEASGRASKLVRELLSFARRELVEPTVLDVDALVTSLRPLLARLAGHDVRLTTASSGGPWTVCADPVQVERVIVNLVTNARDAMAAGGELRIEVSSVAASLQLGGAPAVSLRVSDTGVGMDTATMSRIFEPFFTTRPDSGTGLGLAMVHATVASLGGKILVQSAPGSGTTIEVLLRGHSLTHSEVPRSSRPKARRGNGLVLVVGAEEVLTSSIVRLLEHGGYRVVTANDAETAVNYIRGRGEPALLVLDAQLGGSTGGVDLALELRRIHGQLRVLLMSSLAEASLLDAIEDPDVELIAQPFGAEELLQRVARLIGEADEAHAPV